MGKGGIVATLIGRYAAAFLSCCALSDPGSSVDAMLCLLCEVQYLHEVEYMHSPCEVQSLVCICYAKSGSVGGKPWLCNVHTDATICLGQTETETETETETPPRHTAWDTQPHTHSHTHRDAETLPLLCQDGGGGGGRRLERAPKWRYSSLLAWYRTSRRPIAVSTS
eukprot:1443750-Rhodomonas_salina.1